MIEYKLRDGGSKFGLSYYKNLMSGCLRKERIKIAQKHIAAGAGPTDPIESTPDYFDRGIQFHALAHLWFMRQDKVPLEEVKLLPETASAASNLNQWADTKYLFDWFQSKLKPQLFGKFIGGEIDLGPHQLFEDIDLPLTGAIDLITEPDEQCCAALDVMFDGLNLSDLRKRLGRDPRVAWDYKVITKDDTAGYIDGIQSIAYSMLAERQGLTLDAFVHIFVYRGMTHTYVLESRKKPLPGEEKKYIPNPNHKWWILCVRSDPPTSRREAILRGFLKAVRKRVEFDKDGFPWPIDEPSAIHCRWPGGTCFALEKGICPRY